MTDCCEEEYENECPESEIHYVGEFGTLFYINCGTNISSATNSEVFITRPDGTTIRKEAIPKVFNGSSNYLEIFIEEGDFNQAGKYIGQASVDINTWRGFGKKFKIIVEDAVSSSSSCNSSSSTSSS